MEKAGSERYAWEVISHYLSLVVNARLQQRRLSLSGTINKMTEEQQEDNIINEPSAPAPISVGDKRRNHDDDGGSCSSNHSDSVASSLMSSLSGNNNDSLQPPIHFINSSPTKVGASVEFEDDKANMIAKLMKSHGQVVTLSLVERSSLIKSIIRLSQHVPGCVIRSLLDDISRDRKEKKERVDRRRRRGNAHHNKKSWKSRRRSSDSCETCDEEKVYDGDQLSSHESRMSPGQRSIAQLVGKSTKSLPLSRRRQSALLFVDISGFTKLSTMLDVESFSNCINTYFQEVINQVGSYGGDILKFAGDAIFCEWRVSSRESFQTLEQCVLQAATCAADIVSLCSDYTPAPSRRMSKRRSSTLSSSFRSLITHASVTSDSSRREIALNVKCGIGVGHMAGVHVGDNMSRREFLMLGDPIDQVAAAEAAARHGEVFASPEAIAYLTKMGSVRGDWKSNINDGLPTRLAVRGERFFYAKEEYTPCRGIGLPCEGEKLLRHFDDFDSSELNWLKRMISLYVHPVVVSEEHESSSHVKHETDYDRNVAAAELRNVYTCFISPKIDHNLTGDEEKDQKLFHRLNDIMTITTRHLDRAQGHLRQFILDDKGVVLIFTFGLRGSTFPNMIAQRAIPLTFTIVQSLQDELGIKVAAGATFEKAYCGVVGGVNRHEFAVLGPAVNLAARLMSPKHNSDVILVDKNVRLLTSQIFFRPLPAVKAKGYADPVPIFQPMKISSDQQGSRWGHAKKKFVGRASEIKQSMHVAKEMALNSITSKFLFVSAPSGTGKSSLMVQATETVRAMVKKMKKRVIVTRYISNEGDSRIPFSLFRSIFKDLLLQIKHDDEGSMASSKGSRPSSRRGSSGPVDFEIDKEWDSLSLQSHSTKSSIMSTDATRFRFICEELNAPPEFAEVVGKRLLGLKSTAAPSTASKPPDLDKIVNFIADAFIRCTKNAHLVLLALDDVHWMDEMSWKVVQAIFERSENVLTFCGSRPPSTNHLAVDEKFWSELHGAYKEEGRYMEINLGLFSEIDAQEMIAHHLDISVDKIDGSFLRNVFTSSGGMPHYLSYVLETIKRNDLTVELDNGLIGLKSSESAESKLGFKSVNDLLLYRLDALDSSVRTTLHLAAVLGTEFDLLDAALTYEEMFDVIDSDRFQSAMELCAHFDVAEKEGILEQVLSFTEHEQDEFGDPADEEGNLCTGLEDVFISSSGRKSHPLYSDNRRYRFTHDSWKTSILSVMLDGRKEEMHEQIATVLEREIVEETESKDDLELQIHVFKHWNLSGNFIKAAELALMIGGQLMILGLNSQAILLYDDVLNALEQISPFDSAKKLGGIRSSIIDTFDTNHLELLIKVYISKGKACCNMGVGEGARDAYQSALDILDYAPCASDSEFDRSISFPIFSGLFVVLKMGIIDKEESCSFEKDICKRFVEQARLNNDPVHYGRALAMQGETLARLGNFEEALETLEVIKTIYDIETQHVAICKAYGSDRVGQAFAHSVNWNQALGRTDAALETCMYIIEEIVPKSDPRNVHNTMCLLYSVIIAMKDHELALEARDVVLRRVVAPFDEHFGTGGGTPTKELWGPILMLLDLQGNTGKEVKRIDEYLEWVLEEKNMVIKPAILESAFGAFGVTPTAILGEICFNLARRRECDEYKDTLYSMSVAFMEKAVSNSEQIPFANMYAKRKLREIKDLHN